jgi:hypothetical protein
VVETGVNLQNPFNSDRLEFSASSFSDIGNAIAEGFRINTNDESIAQKLDDQKFGFFINGSQIFTSELDSQFNDGFEEVNTTFEKFSDFNTAVGFDPEDLLERSNLTSLPDSVPKSSALRRFAETGNTDVLDTGLSNLRDVFRAFGKSQFTLKPVQDTVNRVETKPVDSTPTNQDSSMIPELDLKTGGLVLAAGVLGLALLRGDN